MPDRTTFPNRTGTAQQTSLRLAFVADHGMIIDEDQAWQYLSNGYTVFNQEGRPLRMGAQIRTFEIDGRSTAPKPLQSFTDLRQDSTYAAQRERIRRQYALWEEYDNNEGWARREPYYTANNARLQGDIDVNRVIPPRISNTGILRPAHRRSSRREVTFDRQVPEVATPGRRRSAPPSSTSRHDDAGPHHNSGEQATSSAAVDNSTEDRQRQPEPHHSRISYEELLSRFGRPGA